MMTDLNEEVLDAALAQLPDLRGLHVIGCPKADHNCVLRVVRHTPSVENLSLSTSVRFPLKSRCSVFLIELYF